MEKSGPILGGISGAALLALLFSAPGKIAGPVQPTSEPVGSIAASEVPGSASSRILDDNGPWIAVCEEFNKYGTGNAPQPVSWAVYPPGAAEGAKEFTAKQSGEENKFDVRTIPTARLDKCLDSESGNKAVIVTVPDPIKSHLQLQFDRSISAIERAAAAANFNFQRYWFPWESSFSRPANQRSRLSEEQRRIRLLQPGLLVFRNKEGHRLFAFLVAETPTGGLDAQQFENALTYVGQISPGTPGLIAGPEFSGSYLRMADVMLGRATSIATVATAPHPVPRKYFVFATTSTSDVMVDGFRNRIQEAKNDGGLDIDVDQLNFEFRQSESLNQLLSALGGMSYTDDEIAILAEDESAYGWSADQSVRKRSILVLQFPRDLSAIRNAVEEQNASVPSGQAPVLPVLDLPLSLREESQNEHDSPADYAKDQVAADNNRELEQIVQRLRQARIQVAIIMATSPLDRIYLLEYFRRQLPDIRLATLTADALMLGRPNYIDLSGTLVSTDMPLVSQAEVTWTPPPANSTSDASTASRSASIEFRSSAQEAVFLAITSLLAPNPKYLSGPRPPGFLELHECPSISIVGKDGFMFAATSAAPKPVFPCTVAESSQEQVARLRFPAKPQLPWVWIAFLILLAVGSMAHMYLLALNVFLRLPSSRMTVGLQTGTRASVTDTAIDKPTSHQKEKSRSPDSDHLLVRTRAFMRKGLAGLRRNGKYSIWNDSPFTADKLFYLICITDLIFVLEYMAVTASVSVWPNILQFDRSLWWRLLLPLHAIVLMLVLLCAAFLFTRLLRLLRFLQLVDENLEARKRAATGCVFHFVFVTSTLALWQYLLGGGRLGFHPLVGQRSIRLMDGLSPLAAIAIVLGAYLFWSWNQLVRVTMVEIRRVRLNFAMENESKKFSNAATERLDQLESKLHSVIDDPMRWKPEKAAESRFLLFLAVIVAAILLRLSVALRGIDSHSFALWSTVWGFVMLMYVLAASFQHTWVIWSRLRAVLEFLNGTPIREVFGNSTFQNGLPSLRIWKMGGNRRSFLLQKRTVELLRELQPTYVAMAAASGAGRTESFKAQHQQFAVNINDVLNDTVLTSERDDLEGKVLDPKLLLGISECLNTQLPKTHHLFDHPAGRNSLIKAADETLAMYVAMRFVSLIRYALLQIRNSLWFAVWGYICLVVSVTVYPFQGRQSLGTILSILFVCMLAGIATILLQMDQDPVLGALDESKKNKGEADLLSVAGKLITIGGVPLLAILASQFPSVAELLSSWIRPVAETLH